MIDFLSTNSFGTFDSDFTSSSSSSQSFSYDSSYSDLSDLTTGDKSIGSSSFSGESDPIGQAKDIISKIENASVVEQTKSLLSAIQNMVQQIRQRKSELNDIPSMGACLEKDGSVLLEWTFPDFRIGFNIEPNPEVSGWHLVTSERLRGLNMSGQLEKDNMYSNVAFLLDFLRKNI